MASANEQVFLMAQIETVPGLENCEAIAAVDGIDCLWVGHFDLTASMGIAGQFDHPDFLAALDRVAAACHSGARRLASWPQTPKSASNGLIEASARSPIPAISGSTSRHWRRESPNCARPCPEQ